MKLLRSGDFYFTLLILIFILLLVGTAFTYDSRAALVPLVIGIPTALLICLELARRRSRRLSLLLETAYFGGKERKGIDTKGEEETAAESTRHIGREIAAISIISGYAALVMAVGFHLSIPIFVIFYCLVFAKESWWKALLLAAGTWGFIYFVFCIFLKVRFPWSFVF